MMSYMQIIVVALLAAFLASAAPIEIPLWPEGAIPDREDSQTIPLLNVVLPADRTNDTLLIISPGGKLHVFSGRKHADLPRGTWHDLVWTWIERTVK